MAMRAYSTIISVAAMAFLRWLVTVAAMVGLVPATILVIIMVIMAGQISKGAEEETNTPMEEGLRVTWRRVQRWMVAHQNPQHWSLFSTRLSLGLEVTAKYLRRGLVLSSARDAACLEAQLASIHRRRPNESELARWIVVVLVLPVMVDVANAAPVNSISAEKVSPEPEGHIALNVVIIVFIFIVATFGLPRCAQGKLQAFRQWRCGSFQHRLLHAEPLGNEMDGEIESEGHQSVSATAGDCQTAIPEPSRVWATAVWRIFGGRVPLFALHWPLVSNDSEVANRDQDLPGINVARSTPHFQTQTIAEVGSWAGAALVERLGELEDEDLVEPSRHQDEPVVGEDMLVAVDNVATEQQPYGAHKPPSLSACQSGHQPQLYGASVSHLAKSNSR